MEYKYYIEVHAIGNGQVYEEDTWEQIGWTYEIKRCGSRLPSLPPPPSWVRLYDSYEDAQAEVRRSIYADKENGLDSR